MLTKINWLLIGALSILSVGVIGVGAYLIKKPTPVVEVPEEEISEEPIFTEPEELSLTPEVDTSDWNTYRNEELGFEIKYPLNFNVSKMKCILRINDSGEKYVQFYSYCPELPSSPFYVPFPFSEGIVIRKVDIIGGTVIQDIHNLEELEKTIREESGYRPESVDIEKVVIGKDIEGLKVDRSTNKYMAYDFYVQKGGKIIVMSFATEISDSFEETPFKQMLSTFQFID